MHADPDRVGQALDNMLDNAIRHAAREVELSARVLDGFVELHVRDDGPGFPPEFLPRAWERFSRADIARTDDGAGLGLSIIRTENGAITTIASSTDQLVPKTTDVQLANTEYAASTITFVPTFTFGASPTPTPSPAPPNSKRDGTTIYATSYLRNLRRGN